jgi:hypothetical protein
MRRVPTPTSLALDICRKIVFPAILDSEPELCDRLRQAVFRAVRDILARELTRGKPSMPVRLLPPLGDPALALQVSRPPTQPLWARVLDLWGRK